MFTRKEIKNKFWSGETGFGISEVEELTGEDFIYLIDKNQEFDTHNMMADKFYNSDKYNDIYGIRTNKNDIKEFQKMHTAIQNLTSIVLISLDLKSLTDLSD